MTNYLKFSYIFYIKTVNKYQKNKEKLQKEAPERYQILSEEGKEKKQKKKKAWGRFNNLSEEEKEKKGQYRWDWNKNLSEKEKQKKVEYITNYYLTDKKPFLGFYKVVCELRIPRINFRISKYILTYEK